MTVTEFEEKYYLHDSSLEKVEFDAENKKLTLTIDFCFWMQLWYEQGKPENGYIAVTFENVSFYEYEDHEITKILSDLDTEIRTTKIDETGALEILMWESYSKFDDDIYPILKVKAEKVTVAEVRMIDLTTQIIPYKGTGNFIFDYSYDIIKKYLESMRIPYNEEIIAPTDIDPAWHIISISKKSSKYNAVQFFFTKNKLFKICLCEDFEGSLSNGIHTGMTIENALNIDKKLFYNDESELYESPDGYWLDYERDSRKIFTISIFIPAVEREDFYEYNW